MCLLWRGVLMMRETPAILGGSRAYGFPTEDSDWDLVVLVDPATAEKLLDAFPSGANSGDGSIMAGNLNLLLAQSRGEYDVWVQGIEELKARAPVSRDEAVDLFKRLRAGTK